MSEYQRGMAYALGAYTIWGVVPLYFKLITFASAEEIMVHRIGWTVLLLSAIIAVRGQVRQWLRLFTAPGTLAWLLLSTTLIAINWFTYLWAVLNDQIVESSLGYYITPLVSVVLGLVVLREGLRPIQWLALGLVAAGVAGSLLIYGSLPWVAVILGLSFGFYGLVRKRIGIESVNGLAVETTLLIPVALLGIGHLGETAAARFMHPGQLALLAFSAVVTAAPLLLFAAAAVRMPLTAMAFVQFYAPTLSLLIGVFIFDEAFGTQQLFTFGFIWLALIVYCVDLVLVARAGKPTATVQ